MDEPPPSYIEATSSQPTSDRPPANQHPSAPPRPPQRPPQRPLQRPSSQPQPAPASLYSNNPLLPFSFPRGDLCSKCKNTGYKVKKGDICKDCWMKHYLKTNAYNPNPQLPFQYPKKYLCEKCNNTGRKVKNNKTCKDCYERFAPRNNYQSVSSFSSFDPFFGSSLTYTTHIPNQPPAMGYGVPAPMPMPPMPMPPMPHAPYAPYGAPPPPPPPAAPLRVRPGDPRIGGVICGRCRGSGLVHFLLDEELCPVCLGVGRILTSRPQHPPPQQGYYQPPPPRKN